MLSEAEKARMRAYAREHREERRPYYQQRRHDFKARMRDHLGGKCAVCGATADLDIDHIDPSQKSFSPGRMRKSWAETVAELAKCQLLCRPCHVAKHAAKHGSTKRWQKGCRCDLCVQAHRQYRRHRWATDSEYRRRHREYYARRKKAANVDDSS